MKSVCIRSFLDRISCIRIEYGEIPRISLFSVQMRKTTDHKNSEYGHISRRVANTHCITFNNTKNSYMVECATYQLTLQ